MITQSIASPSRLSSRLASSFAHALRKLQGVADAAPVQDGCWATQAAGALVALQQLVAEAIAAAAQTIDPDALATQVHRYRLAAQTGITQTARARMR